MAAPLIKIDARRALHSVGPALRRSTVRGINEVAIGAMRYEKGLFASDRIDVMRLAARWAEVRA